MTLSDVPSPAPRYRPALAWFAAFGSIWVFVLVMMGAFTTSINAGMIFPDWPLSNGSLNPEGWLQDLSMFAEHSHRLTAGLMTVLTLALTLWVQRAEERAWLRRLAWFAFGLVFVQAIVGGLRVLLEHHHVEMLTTSVGRLFAMLHACLAQLYVCTLFAIAAALSRPWIERDAGLEGTPGDSVKRWGALCCGLLALQLAVAAIMRHSFAGLAIPTFPWSTPQGGLLPADWNFRVGIHFAHRALALVLMVTLIVFCLKLWRESATRRSLVRGCALGIPLLLIAQIWLGALSVLSGRNAHLTTAHVLVGALLLATTFVTTWILHRREIDPVARAPQPKQTFNRGWGEARGARV